MHILLFCLSGYDCPDCDTINFRRFRAKLQRYILSFFPLWPFMACSRLNFTFTFTFTLPPPPQFRCATNRRVPGSIPGGVTGFFSDIFPSDQTMALGSTQPLVKVSTRNISGGKGGRYVRLTTYHHTVPLSRNLGALTS